MSLCQGVELRGQPVGVEPYHVGPGYGTEASVTKASHVQGWSMAHNPTRAYRMHHTQCPRQTEVNHEGLDISSGSEYLACMFRALGPSLSHMNLAKGACSREVGWEDQKLKVNLGYIAS